MSGCGNCCGNCGGCGEMILAESEIAILKTLSQIPFLPVARRADTMDPQYFEEDTYPPETYCLALQCLEKRGLISIDYDFPLKGVDYSAYKGFPVHGSFALTAKGQEVCDLLDRLGCE